MRKCIDMFRMIFVSLECVFVIGLCLVAWHFPNIIITIGDIMRSENVLMNWYPILPIGICTYSFKLAWQLTTPLPTSNRILYDYPNYWRLQYRRNMSLIICIMMALIVLCVFLCESKLSDFWLGFLFAMSLGLSVVVILCLAFARLKLKEIVEE